MIRTKTFIALAAVAVALPAIRFARSEDPAPAQQKKVAAALSPKLQETQRLLRLLQEDVDITKAVEGGKLQLKDVVELLSAKLTTSNGKPVPVLVDVQAFRDADPDVADVDSILYAEIDLKGAPRAMPISTLLRVALSKLPKGNGTYVIRQNMIEITTQAQTEPHNLLRRKVAAAFSNTPLDQALEELSEQSGASIVIDGRVGDKAKAPVSATFRNDTALGSALQMLTDMAGLRPVVLEEGLYVTTPENAARMRKNKVLPPRPKLLMDNLP
jgi:hypothetical protein